jgi:hypothetical protein
MALPSSGTLSLSDIKTEFNGVNPIAMGSYYRGGAYVTANNTSVPTSGAISISNFYGASNTVGTTWTQAATYNTVTMRGRFAAYGNGIYVCVGQGLSPILTQSLIYSTDGSTWTGSTALQTVAPYTGQVYFLNGQFIAFSGTSGAAATSTNGTTWTAVSNFPVTGGSVGNLIWTGTTYVLTYQSGGRSYGTYTTTTLGSAWTYYAYSTHSPGGYGPTSIVSAFGKIYGVDLSGVYGTLKANVYVSSDQGQNWTIAKDLYPSGQAYMSQIAFSGSQLIVFGKDTSNLPQVNVSSNGTTWTDVSSAWASVYPGSNISFGMCIWAGANWVVSIYPSSFGSQYIYWSYNGSAVTSAPSAYTALGGSSNLSYSPFLVTNGSGQVVGIGSDLATNYYKIIKSP